ncbi:ribonuclease D [Microbacterium aquimaris]|uniref:HRDC domain-containing protein n=1 Tax=Microbacterium aquimaris TaxID=459816 RepID=A0ABU5N889_9MICO|nr:HRDC domain-containing protein [Microbacterium aquimaris]MDZ8162329.1 HRDC domain-containing protein [Microbacterium aquimaris]
MTEYPVIADRDTFLAACETLAGASGPVAVDVERASGFRYSQRAYLIQIFRRGAGVFLFDPPAIGDFAPLQQAIGDTEWVLHAASQDLPSLRELDLVPPRLFDTELAARLLGHDRVGLGAVVENTLGITLAKAHSASDWSQRPLPQSWLEYAALDVVHLIDVRDVLGGQLEEQEKTDLAAEEFADVRERPPKPPRAEPWRRLSGLHAVRGRKALAVARALWTAREEYAEAEDTAPGRLVPDRALVAAVLADPRSKHDLAQVKEFTGRASRSELDRWWEAIERGRADTDPPRERATGGDTLPPPRAWAQRNPEADLRLKAARPVVEELAEQLRMPTENLLTPDTLRRVAWSPPDDLDAGSIAEALRSWGAREWQIGRTAQAIADAFVSSVQSAESASEADS